MAVVDDLEGALVAGADAGHEGVVGAPARAGGGREARPREAARTRAAVESEASADKGPAHPLPTRASGAGWQLAESFCPPTILRNRDAVLPPRRQPAGLHEYGDGPRTCVLVHGLLLSQKMHRPLARALAERGNRVVTLDLLGHGRSDRPRDMWRYSMPFFGEQVIALLDHLELDEAVSAARRWAPTRRSRPRCHAPERVRGMVVEMPVLDNALLGCAIAFTPLMVALTFGEPVMRLVARGGALVPSGAGPQLADVGLDTIRQDPGPSAAVLQGLFFGRIAPHKAERRTIETPALVIGHAARPGPPVLRLRRAGRRAAQRAGWSRPARSSSCASARSA